MNMSSTQNPAIQNPTLTVLSPDPIEMYPERINIDGILVDAFQNKESLFRRLFAEIEKPGKSLFYNLNVHISNLAHSQRRLKNILQSADVVYCDSDGIVMGGTMSGQTPTLKKFAVADWLFELWDRLAEKGYKIYFLGGVPGVIDKGFEIYSKSRSKHTVVGYHHGYILNDEALEQQVIDHINSVKPDILFVGFGCPLQEYWIDKHKSKLNVSVFWPLGACMDYLSGTVQRSPQIFQQLKLEWFFRLCLEPKRMFMRYVWGNPWFVFRIAKNQILQ
jgi:N-acetylglucosaminyldiphosphoundecaprenol N-acetyl-beta-D-mannosaminyltransferase